MSKADSFIKDKKTAGSLGAVLGNYHNEKVLIDLRVKAEKLIGEEKVENDIKNGEESIKAMKIAKDNLKKFIISFEIGSTH